MNTKNRHSDKNKCDCPNHHTAEYRETHYMNVSGSLLQENKAEE